MTPNYERVAIKSLSFDKCNARKHDKRNIDVIKESLTRFAQQKPIVVSADNVVIAGNGTLQAAIELGWDEIDVKRSHLTGEEAKAYGLVDNRSTDLSSYDDEILKEQLSELDAEGWELDSLGFDDLYIQNIGKEFDMPDEDSDKEKENKLALTVSFQDEEAMQELFLELRDRGFKVKV